MEASAGPRQSQRPGVPIATVDLLLHPHPTPFCRVVRPHAEHPRFAFTAAAVRVRQRRAIEISACVTEHCRGVSPMRPSALISVKFAGRARERRAGRGTPPGAGRPPLPNPGRFAESRPASAARTHDRAAHTESPASSLFAHREKELPSEGGLGRSPQGYRPDTGRTHAAVADRCPIAENLPAEQMQPGAISACLYFSERIVRSILFSHLIDDCANR
jgi:hypothetical protein